MVMEFRLLMPHRRADPPIIAFRFRFLRLEAFISVSKRNSLVSSRSSLARIHSNALSSSSVDMSSESHEGFDRLDLLGGPSPTSSLRMLTSSSSGIKKGFCLESPASYLEKGDEREPAVVRAGDLAEEERSGSVE